MQKRTQLSNNNNSEFKKTLQDQDKSLRIQVIVIPAKAGIFVRLIVTKDCGSVAAMTKLKNTSSRAEQCNSLNSNKKGKQ